MGNNEKAKSLAKNTLLFTISSFGTKLLTFFLIPLYTSVLSTEDYGVADLISVTAAFLMYILTMDIQSSVLRFAIDKNKLTFFKFSLCNNSDCSSKIFTT